MPSGVGATTGFGKPALRSALRASEGGGATFLTVHIDGVPFGCPWAWAIKKARSRDDTLADLIEISMGTPRFRTMVVGGGRADCLQMVDGIGDINLIKI